MTFADGKQVSYSDICMRTEIYIVTELDIRVLLPLVYSNTEKKSKVKLTILGSQFDCDKLTPQKESNELKRVISTPTTTRSLLLVRENF